MQAKALAIASALVLLVVPAVAADNTLLSEGPFATCSGTVDVLCTHIDCNQVFCVIMRCAVYIGHSGHAGGVLFGCTPP